MGLASVTITAAEVAEQTLRAEADYDATLLASALEQAADLLEYVTKNDTWPEADTLGYRMVKRGVIAMADALYVSLPQMRVFMSPFQRETIGNYTYEKLRQLAISGNPFGVPWWDVAIEILTGTTDAAVSESIHLFDQGHGQVELSDGTLVYLGPADRLTTDGWVPQG